jgi:hypothetical protein
MTHDFSGLRFGRLTVVQRAFSRPRLGVFWLCSCDCGNSTTVRAAKLKNGHTVSCGCAKKRHGHAGNGEDVRPSATYSSWTNVVARCTQSSNPAYAHYKKRGITICERWRTFANFLEDMGERPKGTTLDRWPNNNGNYEPGNCRWATKREQANNRVTNIRFEYRGQEHTLAELARASGQSKETLRVRLVRPGGWSVEDAVETPTIPRRLRSAGLSKR